MCGLPYGPPSLFSAATYFNPIGVLSAFLWIVFIVGGVALLVEMVRERRRMTPEERVPWRRTLREYADVLASLGTLLGGLALASLGMSLHLALSRWLGDQSTVLYIQSRLNVACTVDPVFFARQEAAVNQASIVAFVLSMVGIFTMMTYSVGSRIPQLRQALRARREARSGEGG